MRQIILRIIKRLILSLDRLFNYLYVENKNNQKLNIELLNDYSNKENTINFGDFIQAHWKQAVRELYIILNDYYNNKLSELIAEWNAKEISKLKYLHLILLNIKSILNNNY